MYDKSDPRSKLSTARRDPNNSGTTATPASYGLYYKDDPVESDANGRAWYTRGQDLLVNYIDAAPGAIFSRTGQLDEYMIVLPDDGNAIRNHRQGRNEGRVPVIRS